MLPEWLTKADWIDTGSGIANCGSPESFMSVLSVFHKTAKAKADEIENLYKEKDIANYTIKVHALKSSARVIGAGKLSDMARALEEAGKAGDIDTVRADTADLLLAYRSLDEKLSPLDESTGTKKGFTAAMRSDAFATVVEIARSMDYGTMEKLLEDLAGYDLSPEDAELIGRINDSLMQLDWDMIEQLALGQVTDKEK